LPRARLIVDLDDLMSRRTEELLKLGEGFSAGYLSDKMPRWSRSLGGPGLRYERKALRHWETRLCELADELILLSPVEAGMLETRAAGPRRANIRAVPPPQDMIRGPLAIERPLRFVFIGTDALTQNRLTISYLLDLWWRLAPRTPLHIYGRMTRRWQAPPNVRFHGYVDSLADVYDAHSILLSPALLRGGVKTKVLEAFAWGTPVIGNAVTFEGLALPDYPIAGATEAVIKDIDSEASLGRLNAAARIGNEYVRAKHDPKAFAAAWQNIVAGREASTAYAAD
jgi:glycosyltransferase involved in cell wall biosynthesis